MILGILLYICATEHATEDKLQLDHSIAFKMYTDFDEIQRFHQNIYKYY